MPTVSVVVPVYFNEMDLPYLLPSLFNLADANTHYNFEYVFVDDGSRDNSFELLATAAQEDPRVHIVKLSRNFGSNAAILAGLSRASGDCVAVISADLQDPPELISVMLEKWANGAKVVLAARQGREDGVLPRLFANTYYWLFRRFALKDMPKQGFDFALIDRQVADLLAHINERNAYLVGMVLWAGFDREVVYYRRQKRQRGKSRWTLAKKLKYFVDGFVSFSYFPIRLASFIGITLASIGIVYGSVLFTLAIFRGIAVPGWTSLMVVFLMISGAQLIIQGIYGEYLWRTLEETRKRPPYVVDRVVGISDTNYEERQGPQGTLKSADLSEIHDQS